MHILDTDTLTHLHAEHPQVIEHLRRVLDPDVGISIVTKIELLRGRFEYLLKAEDPASLLKAQQRLLRTEELLAQIRIFLFDEKSIREFSRLNQHSRFGKIGRADLLIASIALANRATLVTRNVRHFRQFPGLIIRNWVD